MVEERKEAAPEFISGIIERATMGKRKVINFIPSHRPKKDCQFSLHQIFLWGWKKYNYSAAMGFNGDVAVVNNFFYPLVFKREKNSLSTAYHLWHSRVLYKYALFYVVKSAWENWINFSPFRLLCLSFEHNPPSHRFWRKRLQMSIDFHKKWRRARESE